MNYLLLIVSLMMGVMKNLISKGGGKNFSGLNRLLSINIVTSVFALVIFGVTGLNPKAMFDWKFIFLAILYGTFTMLSQMLFMVAVNKGQVSVCSLIYFSGFIIPTIFGSLYYNEPLSVLGIIGIIVMLASIGLVNGKIQKGNMSLYVKPVFGAMLSSGAVGVLQKVYRNLYGTDGMNDYLFAAFVCMLVFSVIIKLFITAGNKPEKTGRNIWILMGLIAVCTVFTNKFNLFLSGAFPSIVFFPVINGGCIALTAMLSMIIFKEKLTKGQIAGIVLSFVSISLIGAA